MIPRLPAVLVVACLVAHALAPLAAAHAELVESDPPAGGTVESEPFTFTATFSVEMDPDPQRSFIIVRDAGGNEVGRGGVSADDATVMIVELPALAPGDYEARWQARDPTDAHTERGRIPFTVVAAATPSPSPSPTVQPTRAATDAPTTPPTASPTPLPTASPTPAISPPPADGEPAGSTSEVVLALLLAGVVLAAIVAYLALRSRR